MSNQSRAIRSGKVRGLLSRIGAIGERGGTILDVARDPSKWSMWRTDDAEDVASALSSGITDPRAVSLWLKGIGERTADCFHEMLNGSDAPIPATAVDDTLIERYQRAVDGWGKALDQIVVEREKLAALLAETVRAQGGKP